MSVYGKIVDLQKLLQAWERVRQNKPSCGVDQVTWEQFDADAREEIKKLHEELLEHSYQCLPVKVVNLFMGEKVREVALYSMRDKVVQQSAAMELSKIFEPLFSKATYAYRPNRSALLAVERIDNVIRKGPFTHVLKTDITGFFDNILWPKLEGKIRGRIPEEDVLSLIRQSVLAKSLGADGSLAEKRRGVHQGSSLAPVLSNIYLMDFDNEMVVRGGFFVRYSDDIIFLSRSEAEAREVLSEMQVRFQTLGLSISEKKTRLCPISEGFEYLGYAFNETGKTISAKAEGKLAERLETAWLLGRNEPVETRLRKMAEILEGWEQYFRGSRQMSSILEFATLAFLLRGKPELMDIARKRANVRNDYPELAGYLSEIWRENGFYGLEVLEAEEILGLREDERKKVDASEKADISAERMQTPTRTRSADRGQTAERAQAVGTGRKALGGAPGEESDVTVDKNAKADRILPDPEIRNGDANLLQQLRAVMKSEDQDTLTELMQAYADLHQYKKAAFVSGLIMSFDEGRKPLMSGLASAVGISEESGTKGGTSGRVFAQTAFYDGKEGEPRIQGETEDHATAQTAFAGNAGGLPVKLPAMPAFAGNRGGLPAMAEGSGEASAPPTFSEAEMERFMRLFCGREDMFATVDFANGRKNVFMQYRPLTEEVIRRHLAGEMTAATYVQRPNGTARFFVLDIDISRKVFLEARDVPGRLAEGMKKAADTAGRAFAYFQGKGVRLRLELSGGRGYHLWLFFEEWVPVRYLNMLQDRFEAECRPLDDDVSVEFFPNKVRLKAGTAGQCVKLPLGIANAGGGRSALLEDDFSPCASFVRWCDNTPLYSLAKLKRFLALKADSQAAVAFREVSGDLSVFGELDPNCKSVLEKCGLMRYLARKAHDAGYLTHFERQSVLYVFAHLGEEGKAFVHRVMAYTMNYQYEVTEKFIRKVPEKPISCVKLREQYKSVTAELGCSCLFKQRKNCYPSPVLHALAQSREDAADVTIPTSRTLSEEKKQELTEELSIHKRAAVLVGKIVELKKQARRLDQNVRKLERELETLFDAEKIESLELDIGILVRVKRDGGYEWRIEI